MHLLKKTLIFRFGLFELTIKSDVWDFGIFLLAHIVEIGSDLQNALENARQKAKDKWNIFLLDIAEKCLKVIPQQRPSASLICEMLKNYR